jgi:hypothetical protein
MACLQLRLKCGRDIRDQVLIASYAVFAGWVAVRLGPRRALSLGVVWWGALNLGTVLVPPGMRGVFCKCSKKKAYK